MHTAATSKALLALLAVSKEKFLKVWRLSPLLKVLGWVLLAIGGVLGVWALWTFRAMRLLTVGQLGGFIAGFVAVAIFGGFLVGAAALVHAGGVGAQPRVGVRGIPSGPNPLEDFRSDLPSARAGRARGAADTARRKA